MNIIRTCFVSSLTDAPLEFLRVMRQVGLVLLITLQLSRSLELMLKHHPADLKLVHPFHQAAFPSLLVASVTNRRGMFLRSKLRGNQLGSVHPVGTLNLAVLFAMGF